MRERTYLFNVKAHSSNYGLVCHQSSCSKVLFFLFPSYASPESIATCSLFCCWEEKRSGLTGYNINKTNWNADHVQNWFGLVFLAEPCFNSFHRTSSLVRRYSIVLSPYKCNTTRMVGRNRTTTAQDTSLQIKNKHNTIQKQTHTHICISLKPPHIPRYLASH